MDAGPGSHRCQEQLNTENSVMGCVFLCMPASLEVLRQDYHLSGVF